MKRYIDNIKSKELEEGDVKLLTILGFGDVVEILRKRTDFEKINTEWADVLTSYGRLTSMKKVRSYSPK